MSADQGQLFAELDGLFAPDMLACTPPVEVRLLPGDHVAAMRGDSLFAQAADQAECEPTPEEVADLDISSATAIRARLTARTEPVEHLHDVARAWHDRHDPRNDDERPDLSTLAPAYRRSPWEGWFLATATLVDPSARWAERIPPAYERPDADDLFASANTAASGCEYPDCAELATVVARFEHMTATFMHPDYGPCDLAENEITYGGRACCLTHANYYAEAWCPRYPGERSAAWLDIIAPDVIF